MARQHRKKTPTRRQYLPAGGQECRRYSLFFQSAIGIPQSAICSDDSAVHNDGLAGDVV
jgi:hypothetical protein